MKMVLLSAFLMSAPLFGEVVPELSPVPAGVSDKLISAYANASGLRFKFQFDSPKKWTLFRATAPNDGKSATMPNEVYSFGKGKDFKLSYDISRPEKDRDEDCLFDRTVRLSFGDKEESLIYEFNPEAGLSVEVDGVTYTFTAMKNHTIKLTASDSKAHDFSFEPHQPTGSSYQYGGDYYSFEDGYPTSIQFVRWTNTITCDYRLMYHLKMGYFTFVKVPLEGDAASNIQFIFNGRASFSSQKTEGVVFNLNSPKGYEIFLPFVEMSIPAYSVGKEGKLESLAATLSLNTDAYSMREGHEEHYYVLSVDFARYPEGREIMVDGSVPIEIWKVGEPDSKQTIKTPLRFRFKPNSVEKVKEIQAS